MRLFEAHTYQNIKFYLLILVSICLHASIKAQTFPPEPSDLIINISGRESIALDGKWQAHWPGPGARHWIGQDFRANRPEDWQIKIGRLECLQADPAMVMRSVHVITYELQEGSDPFQLSVRTGILHQGYEPDGQSWSGFLVGAGHGILDYRGQPWFITSQEKGET